MILWTQNVFSAHVKFTLSYYNYFIEGVSSDPLQSLGDLIGKQVNDAREKAESEERLKHKRPWDRGKGLYCQILSRPDGWHNF